MLFVGNAPSASADLRFPLDTGSASTYLLTEVTATVKRFGTSMLAYTIELFDLPQRVPTTTEAREEVSAY